MRFHGEEQLRELLVTEVLTVKSQWIFSIHSEYTANTEEIIMYSLLNPHSELQS